MLLKKGISIWAFPDNWELLRCFQLASQAGFDGIELAYHNSGPITPETSAAELKAIQKMCTGAGLEISSLASGIFWEVNLLSEDPLESEAAKFHITRMLEHAAELELPAILVVPGFIGPFEAGAPVIRDYQAAYQRALAAFQELAPTAERLGVAIGIENVWNKFLTSPMEMKAFLDEVGSTAVGSYFDVGNCLRTGYPDQWIRILGEHIKGIHFKDFRVNIGNLQAFVDLLEGDVDYPAVMAALQETGYSGFCVVEVFARTLIPEAVVLRAGADIAHIFKGWVP